MAISTNSDFFMPPICLKAAACLSNRAVDFLANDFAKQPGGVAGAHAIVASPAGSRHVVLYFLRLAEIRTCLFFAGSRRLAGFFHATRAILFHHSAGVLICASGFGGVLFEIFAAFGFGHVVFFAVVALAIVVFLLGERRLAAECIGVVGTRTVGVVAVLILFVGLVLVVAALGRIVNAEDLGEQLVIGGLQDLGRESRGLQLVNHLLAVHWLHLGETGPVTAVVIAIRVRES